MRGKLRAIGEGRAGLASSAQITPAALALLRMASAYLFILHGTAKLLGYPHLQAFNDLHLVSLEGAAAVLETLGGLAVLLGLWVRPVSFILSGEMAFAYFIAHAPRGQVLLPLQNGGESAVLFCFTFLFLAAAGGGAWALDGPIAGHDGP